jgi:hypothetical protein
MDKPLSLRSEIRGLEILLEVLKTSLFSHPTTEEQDVVQLTDLAGENGKMAFERDWKLTCCLHYRITRKRILAKNILALEMVIDWLREWTMDGVSVVRVYMTRLYDT